MHILCSGKYNLLGKKPCSTKYKNANACSVKIQFNRNEALQYLKMRMIAQ